MAAPGRVAQVNNLVQQALNEILLQEHEFPKDVLVTIIRVEATSSLQQAKVYISVIPEEKEQEVLERLEGHIFPIQQALNKRLSMRPVPRIEWVLDKGEAEAQHIRELLDRVKEEE